MLGAVVYIFGNHIFTLVNFRLLHTPSVMKKVVVIIIVLHFAMNSLGQDANIDARYLKSKKLDKSYIGSFVHLLFAKYPAGMGDTVLLAINNTQVQFVGHVYSGEQGGLFYAQYWQSVGDVAGHKLRLVQNRIDAITSDSILVTSYFDSYAKSGALAAGKSIQQQYWYSRKAIPGLLVKVNGSGL